MNIIILEDEINLAEELKAMVEELLPNSTVCATAHSVAEAEQLLSTNRKQIDLIFSDINLGDGLCFELFGRVSIPAPVIFCLTYDKLALDTLKNIGVPYLIKPIYKDNLKRALHKVNTQNGRAEMEQHDFAQVEQQIESKRPSIKTLLVYHRDKIIPLYSKDIILVKTEDGKTCVYSTHKEDFEVNNTLKKLQEKLPEKMFFRANRQFLINRNHIENLEYALERKLIVRMFGFKEDDITISKERTSVFLSWLENGH